MVEWVIWVLGLLFLALGIPLGNFLRDQTKEELAFGQPWFRGIVIASLAGAIVSLFFGNDAILFGFLFVGVITSRSLKR